MPAKALTPPYCVARYTLSLKRLLLYRGCSIIMGKEKGIIIKHGKEAKVTGPVAIEDAPKTPEPKPRSQVLPI